MGSLALVGAAKLKANVTQSTVLAGSVSVGQTQLGVFVGDNIIADPTLYKSVASAVEKCTNALRDAGNPAPSLATNFNKAFVVTTLGAYGVKDINLSLDDADGTVGGENQVAIIVGGLHQSVDSDSITDSVKRGFEKILEDRLKKAA